MPPAHCTLGSGTIHDAGWLRPVAPGICCKFGWSAICCASDAVVEAVISKDGYLLAPPIVAMIRMLSVVLQHKSGVIAHAPNTCMMIGLGHFLGYSSVLSFGPFQ
jgi:hypothetical protein